MPSEEPEDAPQNDLFPEEEKRRIFPDSDGFFTIPNNSDELNSSKYISNI